MKKILSLLFILSSLVNAADILPNQQLQLTVQGVPAAEGSRLNATYPVSTDGTISMWGVGKVRAAGRTPGEVAESLAAAYKKEGIYQDPTFQIIIQGTELEPAKMVTVGGAVNTPGAKPFRDNLTLFEAVSAAGGANAFGALNRVKLFRNAKVYTFNLYNDDHKRIRVYPNDSIEVPQKNWAGR